MVHNPNFNQEVNMGKDNLIELLNEALQIEYSDVFLYPRQADIIKDKAIAEQFENLAGWR